MALTYYFFPITLPCPTRRTFLLFLEILSMSYIKHLDGLVTLPAAPYPKYPRGQLVPHKVLAQMSPSLGGWTWWPLVIHFSAPHTLILFCSFSFTARASTKSISFSTLTWWNINPTGTQISVHFLHWKQSMAHNRCLINIFKRINAAWCFGGKTRLNSPSEKFPAKNYYLPLCYREKHAETEQQKETVLKMQRIMDNKELNSEKTENTNYQAFAIFIEFTSLDKLYSTQLNSHNTFLLGIYLEIFPTSWTDFNFNT